LWAVQVCKGKEQSLGTPIAARHQSHDGSVGLGTGTLEPSLKHRIRQKGQVIAPIVSGAAQSFGGIANGRQLFRHNSVRYLACFLVPLKPIHSLGYQVLATAILARTLKWSSRLVSLSIIARKDASF